MNGKLWSKIKRGARTPAGAALIASGIMTAAVAEHNVKKHFILKERAAQEEMIQAAQKQGAISAYMKEFLIEQIKAGKADRVKKLLERAKKEEGLTDGEFEEKIKRMQKIQEEARRNFVPAKKRPLKHDDRRDMG